MAPPRRFCSEVSREHGEQLAATASRVDRWILIEHHGAWGKDAVDSSGLSAEVKAHLARARGRPAAGEGALHPAPRAAGCGRHPCLLGKLGAGGPWLSSTVVEGYEDLLGLDFADPGRCAGPSVAARLHAREARRVLREVRPTGLRGDARPPRRRVALAVLARGRRPLRGQRRLPARRRVLRARRRRRRPGVARGTSRRPGPARLLSRAILLLVSRAGGRARRPRARQASSVWTSSSFARRRRSSSGPAGRSTRSTSWSSTATSLS